MVSRWFIHEENYSKTFQIQNTMHLKKKEKYMLQTPGLNLKKKTPKFPNNWYEKCPVGILLDKNNSIKSKKLCFSKCDNALLVFKKKKTVLYILPIINSESTTE